MATQLDNPGDRGMQRRDVDEVHPPQPMPKIYNQRELEQHLCDRFLLFTAEVAIISNTHLGLL